MDRFKYQYKESDENLIAVSEQLKRETQSNRHYYVTADVTLTDGTKLSLEKKDFYLSGNSFVDSADSGDFPVGIAIEKTASLCLVNDDDRFSDYQFNRARFAIYANLQLSDKLETIKKGTYIVSKKPTTGAKINLTLLDLMSKADKTYKSSLSFPCSVGEVLREACQRSGIALGDANFTNSDFKVKKKPTSTTYRAVIGMAAALAGGNARIDENDLLRIVTFKEISTTTAVDHELAAVKNVNYDLDTITVSGVKCDDTFYGEEGYVLDLKDNQLVAANKKDALARIGKILNGFTILPFSLTSIAIVYATFGDTVQFKDTKGNAHVSIITDVEFAFNKNTEFSCKAKSVEEQNQNYPDGTQIKVDQSLAEIENNISAYDTKLSQMNELAANALGFYASEEQQEDGSVIVYRHNKPQLSESTVIYKTTADGFFLSTDRGKTWKAGFDSNGDAVLNILYAIGINAGWIEADMITGKHINAKGLTVSQKDGTNTLIIDDEGNIDASFRTLSIAGAAAASENYAEEKSAAALEAAKIYADSKSSNLLQGTDFSTESIKTYWNLSGTVEQSQTDPKGGKNAVRLRGTADDNYLGAKYTVNNPVATAGQYEIRIWLKSNTARTITVSFNREKYQCNVTTSWKQFKFVIKVTEPNTEGKNNFVIGGWSSAPSGAILYIYNPQVLYSYTAADVLNMLTDNGAMDGIYMYNNQLYVKGKYIDVDDLKAIGAKIGGFTIGNSSIYNGCTSLTSTVAGVYLGTTGIMIRKDADSYMRYSVSSGLTLAGGTINAAKINSPTIKIGRATLSAQDTDSAMVVRNGMHVYNATSGELFTDGSGLFKLFNVTHVSSGGHLVFGPDGAEVCYLSSSSKRYKDHVSEMTIEEAEKVLDIPVVWFKYKKGYLRDGDPMTGKPIPGFYAEDVLEKFPAGAQLKDGLAEDWNYRTLIPPMLMLIQKLYREVEKNG